MQFLKDWLLGCSCFSAFFDINSVRGTRFCVLHHFKLFGLAKASTVSSPKVAKEANCCRSNGKHLKMSLHLSTLYRKIPIRSSDSSPGYMDRSCHIGDREDGCSQKARGAFLNKNHGWVADKVVGGVKQPFMVALSFA